MKRVGLFLAGVLLATLCGQASAADPTGWTVTVNSATGQWAAANGMTFTVPAFIKPDGTPAGSGVIDTGLNANINFPGGIGVKAGWVMSPNIEAGFTSAHLTFGFFKQCGQGFPNGGNRMAGGTVTCTNDTGSVSLTVTPY